MEIRMTFPLELESAVNSFREIVRQSWVRRVIRTLTLTNSQTANFISTFTLDDVKLHRDKEWEDREQSYHEAALAELNALVRKYNTLAPYPVRRPYHTRTAELENMFLESAEEIFRTLSDKVQSQTRLGSHIASSRTTTDADSNICPTNARPQSTIFDLIWGWFTQLLGK
jgi:DnaJ family protein C protein 28